MSARERILDRIEAALEGRDASAHPGAFAGRRPEPPRGSSVDTFSANLVAADGEVVVVDGHDAAAAWVASFVRDFEAVVIGETVPPELRPSVATLPADEAPLGVSFARGAIAETGSLLMDARDGRRSQLLAPVHVIFVREATVFATFRDALVELREDLPSAIGLHSGPSKSRDVGQVLVKGVHGPGRLIAVVIGNA